MMRVIQGNVLPKSPSTMLSRRRGHFNELTHNSVLSSPRALAFILGGGGMLVTWCSPGGQTRIQPSVEHSSITRVRANPGLRDTITLNDARVRTFLSYGSVYGKWFKIY